ncbi:hypothetical protein [Aridibaculum aurantiacum]|uniref:hypothetical protein n=1 Tax=Aridibaculum aurantiacum TaxID=2810307 RepID=UPI001A975E95|nr:hypothetical protein [Aridibaculum aurantiacum]
MNTSNKIFNLLLTLFFLLVMAPGIADDRDKEKNNKKEAVKWAVQKTSTLRINGSTNINEFGCDIKGYYQADTIACIEENGVSKTVTLKGALAIDVARFDCYNKIMTTDLQKTLRVKEHPKMIIRFLSLDRNPVMGNNKDFMKGWVEIELAGTTRKFEICYSFAKTNSSLITLNGSRSFSFADFALVPPKKLGGLVKVKDHFDVEFKLLLDPIK